jgi:hypothetical protein
MFEWFGFADTGEGVLLGFFDQLMNAFNDTLVLLLSVEIIFPGCISKNKFHSATLRSVPSPALSCSIAPSRRLAFVGFRSK